MDRRCRDEPVRALTAGLSFTAACARHFLPLSQARGLTSHSLFQPALGGHPVRAVLHLQLSTQRLSLLLDPRCPQACPSHSCPGTFSTPPSGGRCFHSPSSCSVHTANLSLASTLNQGGPTFKCNLGYIESLAQK